MQRLPEDAFIVNEAHWFSLDLVLLVRARGGVLSGARVAGQLLTGPGARRAKDPIAFADATLLASYLSSDPAEPGFLERDPGNFRVSAAEIRSTRVSGRRAMWTGPIPNSGSVTLSPRSGSRRRLILLGEQDLSGFGALLMANGFPMHPIAG